MSYIILARGPYRSSIFCPLVICRPICTFFTAVRTQLFFFFYDDRSYFCVGYSTSLLPLPNFLTSLFNDHPYFSIGHSELLVATRTFPSATRTFMSSVRTFQSCIRIFCRPFVIFPSVRPLLLLFFFRPFVLF